MLKIIASSVAVLDSDVLTGGGTDVTDSLQRVLDMAPENGGVHLVMDGAALVRGLKIHSNTTIECVNRDCGFFMTDYGNRPILSNYNWNAAEITTKDITLIGGTYNHNCTKQVHHLPAEEFPLPPLKDSDGIHTGGHGIMLMEFYGVENLVAKDILFKNQRTYTFCLGCFKNAIIENCSIDMAEHVHPSNQDGFHFFGPGRFLTMRNVRGCTGDDFINVAPDEMDGVSSITDVLIDGVIFDDVCQGIRMLSRKKGLLDRVTVRNVSGTYRTFAFSIQPFYRGETFGKYGDIFIENVDLRQIKETYHYTPLTFMQLGGDIECFKMKNIRFCNPVRNSTFIELGQNFFYRPKEITSEEVKKYQIEDMDTYGKNPDWMPRNIRPVIKTFVMEDAIFEVGKAAEKMNIIEAKYNINNLVLSNIKVFKSSDYTTDGNVLKLSCEANISKLFAEDIYAENFESIISGTAEHNIELVSASNVTLSKGVKALDIDDVNIGKTIKQHINNI
ncbi:MAG: hypothetical protein E7395_07100 [Ruminococcaceae bacterium]|nr:hypothetical protein [Oscillospiraceae bacterium]